MYKHLLINVFRCSFLVGVILVLYFFISSFMLSRYTIIFLIITEIIQGTTYLAEQIPNYFAGFVTSFNTIVLEKLSILVDKFASFFQTLNPIQQQRMIDELEQFTASLTASGASLLKSF